MMLSNGAGAAAEEPNGIAQAGGSAVELDARGAGVCAPSDADPMTMRIADLRMPLS